MQHYRTIAALPLIRAISERMTLIIFETFRTKRNTAEYEMTGVATGQDASETVGFVKELR